MKTCKTCQWCLKNPSDRINPKSFVCVRYPPTGHVMPAQGPGGMIQTAVITTYPVVAEDAPACGEHRELLNA